ncbi:unnamed protein product [Ectocarpus fasciculatus]
MAAGTTFGNRALAAQARQTYSKLLCTDRLRRRVMDDSRRSSQHFRAPTFDLQTIVIEFSALLYTSRRPKNTRVHMRAGATDWPSSQSQPDKHHQHQHTQQHRSPALPRARHDN